MALRVALLLVWIALTLTASVTAWRISARDGLARVEAQGVSDLRLASDRVVGSLLQFREVAVLAAGHPEVVALARKYRHKDAGTNTRRDAKVSLTLQRLADHAGARDIRLIGTDGTVLAGPPDGPQKVAITRALARAEQGATGFDHRIDPANGQRIFTFATPVFAPQGGVIGIVQLRLNARNVEAEGRGNPVPVWFTDADGVSFLTNRTDLVLLAPQGVTPDPAHYPPGSTTPYEPFTRRELLGRVLVSGEGSLRGPGLEISRHLPVIEMTGHALAVTGSVTRAARLAALSTAAGFLAVGAVLFALWERRRALAEANAALEARVTERTAELRDTNAELHRTQAELVQAGKLSALGQMSAGISHELNQPLMAISSYAENAELLLERGRAQEAGASLTRIAEMAHRMGRIIRNLRAFARQESAPATPVELAAVVDRALEMLETRIERAGVRLIWQRPETAAVVLGGEVRLSQVVLNLLSNALDAMEGRPDPQIEIVIRPADTLICLSITDSGPGIADPSRIFDPFYSTKEVGTAEGIGLGLSISYGLIQGFGGSLRGENLPEGRGARFTIELRAAPDGEDSA
ncbi:C4-dicarboxylate ABC transporter [Thioclava dalianensis]|uniref:C4-dicarboxylate transport sensor protein DctB n=1 Tax=Thioclava dalianensis TaxID=1185766 RepID=A0A074TN44_9RHOB|nr:ATP-binding protein [Thioclava dalianensis]KEP71585.1 C4-dicarboxylate ABC transporter [Thioclava dalianensis]SFN43985.1 two-component system, NtrC family, C4-dicarboxylate transport sensor histidine kinase DctB [Thioclava dalianensis]